MHLNSKNAKVIFLNIEKKKKKKQQGTRAGVYETLCPQHVLAFIDNREHHVPYNKNA